MKNYLSKYFFSLVIAGFAGSLYSQSVHTGSGISVVSYLLRDRAVIIDSQADREPLSPDEKERKSDRKIWGYDNSAVDCMNPCYSRYIYGYYIWRQDLDGMNSWGPGTTENSRANPFCY
jgi:hypothetical protein